MNKNYLRQIQRQGGRGERRKGVAGVTLLARPLLRALPQSPESCPGSADCPGRGGSTGGGGGGGGSGSRGAVGHHCQNLGNLCLQLGDVVLLRAHEVCNKRKCIAITICLSNKEFH